MVTWSYFLQDTLFGSSLVRKLEAGKINWEYQDETQVSSKCQHRSFTEAADSDDAMLQWEGEDLN